MTKNLDIHSPPVPHVLTVQDLIDVLSKVKDKSRPVGIVDIDQVDNLGDVSVTHDYRITYNFLQPNDLSGVGILLWSARSFYEMIRQQQENLEEYVSELQRRRQEARDNTD